MKIPAGKYRLGKDQHPLNPPHEVELKAFEIGRKEVSNAEFAAFVEATGYRTLAEKRQNAKVFHAGLEEFEWETDSTANWRFPNGIGLGGIEDKMDHPVTSISYFDAMAYCEWAKVRLPSLDEWELASRGAAQTDYFWGKDRKRIGDFANIWHGKDHLQADTGDPWPYTSPGGSLSSNPFGLQDIYGNVFEFCADRPARLANDSDLVCARGGSWWCSVNACSFFNSFDIGRVKKWASFSNQGFRVVRDLASDEKVSD